jgi:hypothetical protein
MNPAIEATIIFNATALDDAITEFRNNLGSEAISMALM